MNNTAMKEEKTSQSVNGVNLETMMATVNAIQSEPVPGASRFRASNVWLGGNHNRSTVTEFHGANQDIQHKQVHTMKAGEPAILAGEDEGANPVEHQLHALACCLTTSMMAHAAVRGIEIEELETEPEGDIDLRGFLGLDSNVPKGYTEIRAKFLVKAKSEDVKRIKGWPSFRRSTTPSLAGPTSRST